MKMMKMMKAGQKEKKTRMEKEKVTFSIVKTQNL